jgi:alpha/beta superfamily hydrolase
MVMKGQFLERPTLIPVGEVVLEGISHRGHKRPGLLVLPPPPIEGGGMDTVVGAELAYAISHLGHPTLRFNYRGVGASQGQPSRSVDDWLADARAALELARDNADGAAPVVATLGASDAVGLKLAGLEPIAGLVFINPSIVCGRDLLGGGPGDWEVAVVVGEHDPTQDRVGWSVALQELGGEFTVVPGANRAFQRNLPMVGKAVGALVERAGRGQSTG